MSQKKTTEVVGHIGIDAGLCWIGDPCYVLGDDASFRVRSWDKFCSKLGKDYPQIAQPIGDGIGFAISTGIGDGYYPVTVETVDLGKSWGKRVSRVTIDFGIEDIEEEE